MSDARALAEAVVDVLEERGLIVTPVGASSRVLDAADVGRLLGRDRQWVYEHAAELGAFRFGDGPKARLGFDLMALERWKRERQIRTPSPPRPARRRRSGSAMGAKPIPYEGSSAGP